MFVFAAVLYPYVYLTARASFVQQSVCALEVARTLGRTSMGAFWEVALLARPAIVAGVALVLMECLNDLGAVQYLGVTTLTASIYATWLQRSNLGGAAQLSAIMLVFIAALFAAERTARGGALSHHTSRRYRSIPFQDLEGWRGYAATLLCAMPFVIGFVIPFGVLVRHALVHATRDTLGVFLSAAWSSLLLASLTALAAILIGLALAYARRVAANRLTRSAVRFAGLGYAIPGTVLAIGLLIPLAQFDNRVDELMRSTFGISTGLLLSGSLFALTLAYVIRFLAVALGSIEAGFERISPNLDAAARALGESAVGALARAPAAAAAGARGGGAAGLRRFDEGVAGDAAAASLQLRDAGDVRLRLRRARAVRAGCARRPHDRARRSHSRAAPAQGGRRRARGQQRRLRFPRRTPGFGRQLRSIHRRFFRARSSPRNTLGGC